MEVLRQHFWKPLLEQHGERNLTATPNLHPPQNGVSNGEDSVETQVLNVKGAYFIVEWRVTDFVLIKVDFVTPWPKSLLGQAAKTTV